MTPPPPSRRNRQHEAQSKVRYCETAAQVFWKFKEPCKCVSQQCILVVASWISPCSLHNGDIDDTIIRIITQADQYSVQSFC